MKLPFIQIIKTNSISIVIVFASLLTACGVIDDKDKELGFPYDPHRPLLAQQASGGPILVTSNAGVSMAALDQAASTMAIMVRNRPDVVQSLRKNGTVIAIYGKDENVCSLPYWDYLVDTEYCDLKKVIGVGNNRTSTCGERNLLKMSNDPAYRGNNYYGSNVCVHEFAHTIMIGGVTDTERKKITNRFLQIQQNGLWRGGYAATNEHEFFAEASQSYFCANMGIPDTNDRIPNNCPENLSKYDYETYALLDSIYLGTANLRINQLKK
jgi:hypothetical protein